MRVNGTRTYVRPPKAKAAITSGCPPLTAATIAQRLTRTQEFARSMFVSTYPLLGVFTTQSAGNSHAGTCSPRTHTPQQPSLASPAAAIYRHGGIEVGEHSMAPQQHTFPGLGCRSTRAENPARGSTQLLLRSIKSAQRRMIRVTRHMSALTQMLQQVVFALPQKCSASLTMQEFAR